MELISPPPPQPSPLEGGGSFDSTLSIEKSAPWCFSGAKAIIENNNYREN
jgi:hypothetical protein